MPDITLAPVRIDVSAQQSTQGSIGFSEPFFQGPIKVGSNLYVMLQGPVAPRHVNVFKSTDGGASWTMMDGGNSPTVTGISNIFRISSYLNPNGTTITISYSPTVNNNPTTISWITFDTITDTFGVPGTIPDLTSNNPFDGGLSLLSLDFVVRANGEIVAAWSQVVAPNTNHVSAGYSILSGGVWGAFVVVAAGDDATQLDWGGPSALVLDLNTGITHWFLIKNTNQPSTVLNDAYLTLSPANVSSAITVLSSRTSPDNDLPSYGRPVISSAQDALVMPTYVFTQPGYTMRAYYGTPVSAPVWTITDLESGGGLGFIQAQFGHAMAVDSDVWAVWVNQPDFVTVELHRSICTAGVWGAVQVFYDLVTNPPNANPLASQVMLGGTCAQIGSVGAVISVNDPGLPQKLAYFLLQATVPPPVTTATLTLVKSVSPGGQAVAGDFILSATGPTTISGAGGVGPSVVPVGTYILAETPIAGYQQRTWSLSGGGTLVGNQLTLAANDVAVVTLVNDPVKKSSGGGAKFFPRYLNLTLLMNQLQMHQAPLSAFFAFPNDFDTCLAREWRLFHQIDPTAMSCGRKPSCFLEGFEAKEWVDPPHGFIRFNPDKAIPLPDPVSGDVTIFSFRVPIGFDGILLGQYHGYAGLGTFIEGGGDLAWRVRVAGRYLRDMGNMLVSLGSPQQISPCPGGLWLHSGNLVEYIVTAPNTSSMLPLPGQGNILAGLTGFFFPRK